MFHMLSCFKLKPGTNQNGDIYIAYIRDISDRIAAKNELVKAKEAAEAASEAKSRFLTTMSHEIRTPFNAVLGILDILAETELNDNQFNLVKTAESSSIALLRVINDVLDYARMSSDEANLKSNPFLANTVFDDVVQLFYGQARDKGLEIEIISDSANDDLYLMGDLGRIRQILLNFVSNAIKFTKDGTLTLSIELTPSDSGGFLLKCSVTDTGIGISSDVVDRLFEEFYMVDDTETREFEGTGLGLTISKRLTDLMGGQIGCKSEEGEGSTFWISIPLASCDAVSAISRFEEKEFDMKSCRILVAEDNLTNQMVLRHTMKKRCASLTLVNNGAEALDALDRSDYDLILMDIFMPKMNGKEATRAIRASDKPYKNIPIIALTAMGNFQDLEALKDDGVNEIVTKPFKKSDLFKAIGSVLGDEIEPEITVVEVTETLEFGGFAVHLDEDEIPQFQEQLKSDLEGIHTQYKVMLAEKDWVGCERPSHTLKGLSGTYGMMELCELSETLNENVKNGEFETCHELVTQSLKMLSDYIQDMDGLFQRVRNAA